MSKKMLKIASRRPMLLALIVMATLTLGLLFSGWFTPTPGRAQQGGGNPQSGVESYTNCTSDGSVSLIAPANTPAGYIGSLISVSLGGVVANSADVTITTDYPDGSSSTTDYFPNPAYVVTWAVSGVTTDTTSGTGTTASFTPTSGGCGTVTFTVNYTNQTPCSSAGSSSVQGNFSVAQLSTNCTSGTVALGSILSASNLRFAPGAVVSLYATNSSVTNVIVVTTSWPCSTNPPTYATNFVSPVILSNWWTASVGSYSAHGNGLSASFTPTNGGCGTITFYGAYIDNTPCNTNVQGATPLTLNFSVAVLSTNCTSGTVALGSSLSASNLCFAPGASVSLYATNSNVTNAIVVTTSWPCSTNPPTSVTNFVSAIAFSNTWTASVGSYSTNGNGLTAAFTPTNGGCGQITFSGYFKNSTPCDTNAYPATPLTLNFSVAVLSTNCTSVTVALGQSSTNINFCFGSGVSLSATNNNVTNSVWVTTHWPCSTNADTYSPTNHVIPVTFSNRWTLSYGSFNTNGQGLTAVFTPTNPGSGTITFDEYYKQNTPCDTNVYTAASLTIPFNVIQLTSQCLATTPTNLARTTIGVCEQVQLNLVGGPSSTTWAIPKGGGSLDTTNGTGPITFTAPDTNDSCTVVASYPGSGGCSTTTFTIKPPSGIQFVKLGEKHIQNTCSAGFRSQVIILDTNVSFYNIEISELSCVATSVSGGYVGIGPHPDWTTQGLGWLTPAQNNYLPTSVDGVFSQRPLPFAGGGYTWPIPWNYRKHGATDNGHYITTLNHVISATSTNCVAEKNGVSATFINTDATVNW